MLLSTCGGKTPGVSVMILPETVDLAPLTSQQFQVTVNGTLHQEVIWTLRTIDHLEESLAGTLDSTGFYTAANSIPPSAQNYIVIQATSTVDATKLAEAVVQIIPYPIVPGYGPSSGGTTVQISGEGFSTATPPIVTFGGIEANVAVQTEVLIFAQTPAHAIGPVDVKITQTTTDNKTVEITYPSAFKYSASAVQFSGGTLLNPCYYQPGLVEAVDLDPGTGDDCKKYDLIALCETQNQLGVIPSLDPLKPPQLFQIFGSYGLNWKITDLNGDGYPEIIINHGKTLTVLANKGVTPDSTLCGTWQGFTSYEITLPELEVTGTASGFEIADWINNDDNPDLAFAVYAQDKVIVLNGTASAPYFLTDAPTTLSIASAADGPIDVAAANFNGGGLDLLVSLSSYTAVPGFGVFSGDGNSLDPSGLYYKLDPDNEPGTGVGQIAVAEITGGNSSQEVIVAMPHTDPVLAGLSWGGSTFISIDSSPFTGSTAGYYLYAGAFNADEPQDIASHSLTPSSSFDILWGSTDSENALKSYTAAMTIDHLALKDVIGNDGIAEAIISGPDSAYVMVEHGYLDEGENYPDFGPLPTALAYEPSGVVVVPLGADAQDTVVVTLPDYGLTLLPKPISSGSQNTQILLLTDRHFIRVISADFNNIDTAPDLIVLHDGSDPEPPSLWFLLSNENGFRDPVEVAILLSGDDDQDQVRDIITGDFDGDGALDLFVAFGDGYPNPQGAIGVIWGLDTQDLEQDAIPLSPEIEILAERMIPADLDNDGDLDIVLIDQSSNQIHILENLGDTSFELTTQSPIQVGDSPRDVAIKDINGDAIPDIVVLAREVLPSAIFRTEVDVLLNVGGLQYSSPARHRISGEPFALAIGDLNADGIPDIAVTTFNPPSVILFPGLENGQFIDPFLLVAGADPRGLGLIDFNEDGLLDIVVADGESQALRRLENVSQ